MSERSVVNLQNLKHDLTLLDEALVSNLDLLQIWQCEYLPIKVKRRLVLQKLGFNIDYQYIVSYGTFLDNFSAILNTIQKNGWATIGINTALHHDSGLLSTPLVTLDLNNDLSRLKSRVLEKFDTIFGEDYLIIYKFVWNDKDDVVGSTILFESNPSNWKSYFEYEFLVEIEAGVWPRHFGYYNTSKLISQKRLFEASSKVSVKLNNHNDNDKLLDCYQKLLRYILCSENRLGISCIFAVSRAKSLVLEFQHYKRNLITLDFHYCQ